MEGLQNSKIVAQADLDGLRIIQANQLQMVQGLGKFKGVLDGDFNLVIDNLNKQITALEQEVARNHKLTD